MGTNGEPSMKCDGMAYTDADQVPEDKLVFLFLPKRSTVTGKLLWLTFTYHRHTRTYLPYVPDIHAWYSQKEYVWLKLKGEI